MTAPLQYGLPMARYLELPAAGSSTLATLLSKSPYHAWFGSYLNPEREPENSHQADAGTVAHMLLLEGNEDRLTIIDADDWRTKLAKELRDAAYAIGKVPILRHKLDPIYKMVDVAREYVAQSELAGIFERGKPEVTGTWQENGALFRLRADFLTDDNALLLDYKSTATNAEPNSWVRQLVSMGYDVQAALYARGIEALTSTAPKVVFLIQENEPPFACSMVALAPSLLDLANRKTEAAMDQWQRCLKAENWPSYPTRIAWAEAPAWAQAQFEERTYGPLDKDGLPATGLIEGTGKIDFDIAGQP